MNAFNTYITPLGDTLLYGCKFNYCKYCKYDPYPARCLAILDSLNCRREIKEIRLYSEV